MPDPPRAASRSPARRPGAPAIHLDTSAVGVPAAMDQPAIPLHAVSNPPTSQEETQQQQPPQTSQSQTLSSPASPISQKNLLAVPGQPQRKDSFDSDAGATSLGGDTAVGPGSTAGKDPQRYLTEESNTHYLANDEDALKPDPGTEADFEVTDNKFAYTPGHLSKLFPKNFKAFYALGGLSGLEKGLRTNLKSGLNVDEDRLEGQVSFDDARNVQNVTESPSKDAEEPNLARSTTREMNEASKRDVSFVDRKRVFSDNRLPERKTKNLLQLMWMAYNDKILILLSIAAVVSLAVGIYQSVDAAEGEAPVEWVEGVAIIVAIFIVVAVGALNDFQKERQFVKLNKKKDDRYIKVMRSGKMQELLVHDVLVGDIVALESGDVVPVDGIYIDGHNVKCDESSATGESDIMKKTSGKEVYRAMSQGESIKKMDPFIISGSRVNEGVGTFVATATGINCSFGKTLLSLREDSESTPLQSKLNVLAEYIAKLGSAAALLYFIVCFIEFLVRITGNGRDAGLRSAEKGQQFLNIFVTAVSVIVVAVPEGLPLAVTLALAFATTRMLKDNNLVRLLKSCETMGGATTVCSDKTGTLTQNKMTVVAGTLSTFFRFGDEQGIVEPPATRGKLRETADSEVTQSEFFKMLPESTKELLEQSIAINTTAFEGEVDGVRSFIGSKTETALLNMAQDYLGMQSVATERSSADCVQFVPFDSTRKCMASIVRLRDGRYRMYVKGASELMLERCTHIIRDPRSGTEPAYMEDGMRQSLEQIIHAYASRSLRTLAFLYKDFESWPPKEARKDEDDKTQAVFEDVFHRMAFLGVVGIQDPLREGVTAAVESCKRAHVKVRMVTGDNIETAKAIATQCGIYTGGEIMEGSEFRQLSRSVLREKVKNLEVLARSSPEDKKKLVKFLKDNGETVAVTGDGTNDAPALKTADVGFSMGIAGTEVAKEASDIILMDDNFASIVKALMWGRAVNDAVKKFLQFQITVNITAVIITFISGVSADDGTPVLTAVQLLWINLIMDTFAALALATDPPADSILDRLPDRKSAPLITLTMWKMIIGQAIYQLVVVLVLYYRGNDILSYQSTDEREKLPALIFNIFVWMQIFNAFNNRRLDNRFNIFEGIQRNLFFIGIILIMMGGQVLIIFVGGDAISVKPLNGAQWGYSLVLGALVIPIGAAIRLVPDELVDRLYPNFLRPKQKTPRFTVEDEEQSYIWFEPIETIRDELTFLRKYKGGRLNNLRFKIQHPRQAGILPSRPSSNRSRSSTNASSMPKTPEVTQQIKGVVPDPPRPSTPRPNTSPAENTYLTAGNQLSPTRIPTPEIQRPPRSRGRGRSGSAIATTIAAAGVVAGGIGGWSPSPIDRRPDADAAFDRYDTHRRSRSDAGEQTDSSPTKRGESSKQNTLSPTR